MIAISFLRGHLFAIIKSLHHTSWIWTGFWKQKVILENSTSYASDAVDFLMILVFLEILHEARLGFIHRVRLCWLVETARCCILLLILLLLHENHAVILNGTVTCLVAAVVGSTNGASPIRKLPILLRGRLIKWVSMAISCRFSSATYCCMVTTVINALSWHCLIESHETAWSRITNRLLPAMNRVLNRILVQNVVILCIMVKLHWIAHASLLTSFTQFGLSYGLIYRIARTIHWILRRIEKLSCHHHLLLLISIGSFSLIHKVENLGLVWICGPYSIIGRTKSVSICLV